MGLILKRLTLTFAPYILQALLTAFQRMNDKKPMTFELGKHSDTNVSALNISQLLKPITRNLSLNSNSAAIDVGKNAPHWFQIAVRELGIAEESGRRKNNKRILQYSEATFMRASDDETPWCATFLCWVFESVGIQSPRSPVARAFLQWGTALTEPKKGCVVVLKSGSEAWQGHCGLFVAENDAEVFLLGGNQGNRVSVAPFAKRKVLGYRWPDVDPGTLTR